MCQRLQKVTGCSKEIIQHITTCEMLNGCFYTSDFEHLKQTVYKLVVLEVHLTNF